MTAKAGAVSRPLGQGQRLAEEMLGQHLDDYRLTKVLGRGGMGVVFEAVHAQIGRRVALKVLWNDLARDSSVRQRFRGEAQAANRIEHPNVVDITDLREAADGTLYLVMELLLGDSLRKRLDASPRGLEPVAALRIAHSCALALAAAHQGGIVHRDFKPENVMLLANSDGERVKVLDFGIAKILYDSQKEDLTNPMLSAFLGTLEYAAPEQFGDPGMLDDGSGREPAPIGPPADVFALGVTLCELLSGQRPFSGFSMLLHLAEPPAPKLPEPLSPALRALLLAMLARDPSGRPSMAEVARQLAAELAARQPPPAATSRRPAAWMLALAGGLVGTLAVALAGVLLWPRSRELDQAQLYVPSALALLRRGIAEKEVGVRRAATLAISSAGQSDLAELLVPVLSDADPRTAELAAIGLQRLQTPTAQSALLSRAEALPVAMINVEAAAALERLQAPVGRALLERFLNSGIATIHYGAAVRLCERQQTIGCAALRRALEQKRLGPEREVDALYTLAAAQDAAAGPALQQRLLATADKAAQLGIAGNLARLPGPWAATALRTLVEAAQARDFDAAVLAAKVQQTAGRETLIAKLHDRQGSPALRITAASALADQGRLFGSVEPLGRLLSDASERLDVRLAAAAALLRLVGPGAAASDEEDLEKLCLRSPRLVACQLADLRRPSESEPGDDDAAYAAPERALIARVLAGRPGRRSLQVLLRALEDPDYVVRGSALRSLRSVRALLRSRGEDSAEQSVRSISQRLAQSGQAVDQVIGLSLRQGEPAAQAQLLLILNRTDSVQLRTLVMELSDGWADNPLLLQGLKDAAIEVRFAAARRLAAVRSSLAIPVLQEVLALGDGSSLIAYALLQRMGQAGPQAAEIDWAHVLSSEQRLWTRFEAVGELGDLPWAQALPLLWIALRDPAAVVRHRAAEAAMAHYHRSPRGRVAESVREILTLLAADDELYVRRRAQLLLREISPSASTAPAPLRPLPPLAPSLAEGPVPTSPPPEASRSPGVAAPSATVAPGPVPPTSPPPERPAQARVEARPPAPAKLVNSSESPVVEQALKQAQRAESSGNLIEAMHALERAQRAQPSPRQRAELQAGYARLRRDLAAYRIQSPRGGACVKNELVWHKPGKHLVSNADGKEFITTLSAGKEYICDFCAASGGYSCKEIH